MRIGRPASVRPASVSTGPFSPRPESSVCSSGETEMRPLVISLPTAISTKFECANRSSTVCRPLPMCIRPSCVRPRSEAVENSSSTYWIERPR